MATISQLGFDHLKQMGHNIKGLSTSLMRKKWFVLFMRVITGVIMLARVTSSDDQTGVPDATGILCISDCATCPVICSPPPPPYKSHQSPSPPPPENYSPPKSSSYSYSPPPPSLLPPPPPSSSYSSWGIPPPPFTYWNIPSGPTPPSMGGGSGPHDYSYPYYYFYSSEAHSLSLHAAVSILIVLLSFHVMFF